MSYKLFLMDNAYPWDIAHEDGPWSIVKTPEHFIEHISAFGIPSAVSFNGSLGIVAAKWLVDTCRDLGHRFPRYYGTSECLDYIYQEQSRGHIFQ